MTSRRQAIIELLDQADGIPLTSAQLSIELNVSPKTVRNDIKKLNSQLKSYHIHIESERGKGYILKVKNRKNLREFFDDYIKKNLSTVPSTSEERVSFLLEKLLFYSDYLKIYVL